MYYHNPTKSLWLQFELWENSVQKIVAATMMGGFFYICSYKMLGVEGLSCEMTAIVNMTATNFSTHGMAIRVLLLHYDLPRYLRSSLRVFKLTNAWTSQLHQGVAQELLTDNRIRCCTSNKVHVCKLYSRLIWCFGKGRAGPRGH
jgi:hypothetical protein